MTTLYANPYSGARGFTFDSAEQFEERMSKLRARGVEEVEIEFHDGEKAEGELFETLWKHGLLNFSNLDRYFDDVVALNEHDQAALYWLVADAGYDAKQGDLDDALTKVDDAIRMFEGEVEDYAHELIDDIGVEGVTNPQAYFDFEQFGRDAKMDLDSDDPGQDMSDEEYGEELADSMGFDSLGKDLLERYFDYEAFARDLSLGGDVAEVTFADKDWVCTTPHEA